MYNRQYNNLCWKVNGFRKNVFCTWFLTVEANNRWTIILLNKYEWLNPSLLIPITIIWNLHSLKLLIWPRYTKSCFSKQIRLASGMGYNTQLILFQIEILLHLLWHLHYVLRYIVDWRRSHKVSHDIFCWLFSYVLRLLLLHKIIIP